MKTTIFLGAGASAAEGAPIQSELFKKYFSSESIAKLPLIQKVLSQFFERIFQIDITKSLKTVAFPTFEEALGVLDLSENRRESLKGFDLAAELIAETAALNQSYSNQVNLTRYYLTLAMAKTIDDGLKKKSKLRKQGQPVPQYHLQLVDNLRKENLLRQTVFISTNYDLCIDEALRNELDYGVEFAGSNKFGGTGRGNRVSLFKIHGSLNWLYCPVCNNLNGYEVKAVLSLLYPERPINNCAFCRTIMSPVIVPPTFYKDMSRVFLSSIWNKTENTLREVDHIIFCGYSLPDADMHIKYLLKRMQTNRQPDQKTGQIQKVRFTVVSNHPDKTKAAAGAERKRYQRYFGKENINYTDMSFEEFAQKPKQLYIMNK